MYYKLHKINFGYLVATSEFIEMQIEISMNDQQIHEVFFRFSIFKIILPLLRPL